MSATCKHDGFHTGHLTWLGRLALRLPMWSGAWSGVLRARLATRRCDAWRATS